jgi:hypothetical protein
LVVRDRLDLSTFRSGWQTTNPTKPAAYSACPSKDPQNTPPLRQIRKMYGMTLALRRGGN